MKTLGEFLSHEWGGLGSEFDARLTGNAGFHSLFDHLVDSWEPDRLADELLRLYDALVRGRAMSTFFCRRELGMIMR